MREVCGLYQIMMVDDDPTSLAIGRALLEKRYRLELMHSGVQALGSLKSGNLPDIILLDMVMPGFSGIEMLKAMKEDERYCEIPVMILTAENHVEDEMKCYRAGAADFLQKPLNHEMLIFKVERLLSCLELKRENEQLKKGIEQIRRQCNQMLLLKMEQGH